MGLRSPLKEGGVSAAQHAQHGHSFLGQKRVRHRGRAAEPARGQKVQLLQRVNIAEPA
jgi:hypothetical protein